MKQITALLCAALLACLCFACGEKPGPTPPSPTAAPLLTLYAGDLPLRIITQEEGVYAAFQQLEYEPTLGFLRPIADLWDKTLEPGKEYTIDAGIELKPGRPQYRPTVWQGDGVAIHDLTASDMAGGGAVEINEPWVPAPIDENSPMIHLCRMASFVPGFETYDYWYAIANAIATLRAVDLDLPLDDEHGYRVYEWLMEAYAAALFPGIEMPMPDDDDWVRYQPDTAERYLVGWEAYSTWIWAEYKSAQRNPDGTWDMTITVGTTDDDETMDAIIKLAPNETYNPDSPFEYHLVGLPLEPDMYYGQPAGYDPWEGFEDYGDAG